MSSNWIRGKAERPEKRRVVLIYETGDAKNAALEQLLERIPYGAGNKTLLECLRVGAKAMLAQSGIAIHEQTTRKTQPPPAPAPVQQEVVGSAAESSQSNGVSFSKSATRMFEQ